MPKIGPAAIHPFVSAVRTLLIAVLANSSNPDPETKAAAHAVGGGAVSSRFRAARNSDGMNCYVSRSFGFEFQGSCSAFTSWRARKRDPKTFSLAAHHQELVVGHVTFVLQ